MGERWEAANNWQETRPKDWTPQEEAQLQRKLDQQYIEPWPILEPFSEGYDQGAVFPVDSLDGTLQDYVLAVAESLQVPVDMVGTVCLGILSACVQGKWSIHAGPDWFEPLNLYTCIVAEPGERKSAVLSRLRKPLDQYEREQREQNNLEVKQSAAMHNALERKVSSVQERFAKGKATQEEVNAAVADLEGHEVLYPLKLSTADVTPEKLAVLLYENQERMAVLSAEGGIFETMSGRKYGNGGDNFDIFLQGHAGDRVQVDRLGRYPVTLHAPALTMVLMVQPSVLDNILSNRSFRGKGLIARFLYAYPPTLLGHRKIRTRQVPEALEMAYRELVTQLLDIRIPREQRGLLRLSPEAREYLDRYRCYIEQGLDKNTGAYRSMTDWAGKLPGAVARMAGILHCVQHHGEGVALDQVPVSDETMGRAAELGNYFLAIASGIYARNGKDGPVAGAQKLWERIQAKGYLNLISRDDLGKVGRNLFPSAQERNTAVEELICRGYLRVYRPPEGVTPTMGRPKTLYEIRPKSEMGNTIQEAGA